MLLEEDSEKTALLSAEQEYTQATSAGSQIDDNEPANVEQSKWCEDSLRLGAGHVGCLDENESVFWDQLIERLVCRK